MIATWRTRCPLISIGDRQWIAWECRKMSISELKEYKNILLEKRDKRDNNRTIIDDYIAVIDYYLNKRTNAQRYSIGSKLPYYLL